MAYVRFVVADEVEVAAGRQVGEGERVLLIGEPARAADPSTDAAGYTVSSAGARVTSYTGKLCP